MKKLSKPLQNTKPEDIFEECVSSYRDKKKVTCLIKCKGLVQSDAVLYDKVVEYTAVNFAFVGELLQFVSPLVLFQGLIPIALSLGVGIGFLGSIWTIRKHLKV